MLLSQSGLTPCGKASCEVFTFFSRFTFSVFLFFSFPLFLSLFSLSLLVFLVFSFSVFFFLFCSPLFSLLVLFFFYSFFSTFSLTFSTFSFCLLSSPSVFSLFFFFVLSLLFVSPIFLSLVFSLSNDAELVVWRHCKPSSRIKMEEVFLVPCGQWSATIGDWWRCHVVKDQRGRHRHSELTAGCQAGVYTVQEVEPDHGLPEDAVIELSGCRAVGARESPNQETCKFAWDTDDSCSVSSGSLSPDSGTLSRYGCPKKPELVIDSDVGFHVVETDE